LQLLTQHTLTQEPDKDMEMESINLPNAYLNGELKDVKVYMCQPEGFVSGKPGEVAHLDKGSMGSGMVVDAGLRSLTLDWMHSVSLN
jgi:hypothetical protein